GNVAWANQWVRSRFAWIDQQFLKPPVFGRPPGRVDGAYQLVISAPNGSILFTLDGSDPRADGGGVSSKAQNYSTPFEIQTNVHIFARAYLEGAWSPPRKGVFFTGLPALTISEVMYHPEAPEPGSEFKREEF